MNSVGNNSSESDDFISDDISDEIDEAHPVAPWVKFGIAAAGVALVMFIAVLAVSDGTDGDGQVDSPLIGRAVPPLVGATLDGGMFDIDNAQGQWVLLNFFASWCVPCQVEHPELVELSNRFGDGSGTVVSVVMGDTVENTERFFAERGGDWPVLIDADAAPAQFVVVQVPESFLIAPSGLVVAKWIGDITADMVEDVIVELTAPVAQP